MGENLSLQIGERIALQRQKLNLSQAKLGELSDLSARIISCSERGKNTLRADNLVKIAQVLGVTTDYLLTGDTISNDLKDLCDIVSILSLQQRKSLIKLVEAYAEAVSTQ